MSLRQTVAQARKLEPDLPTGSLVLRILPDLALGSDRCPGDQDLLQAILSQDENLETWLRDRPSWHVHSLAAALRACPLLVEAALAQFQLPNHGTEYRSNQLQNNWNVMPLDEQFETARPALEHYAELEDAAAALGLIKGAFARLMASSWGHLIQRPVAARPVEAARKMRVEQTKLGRHANWAAGLRAAYSLRQYAKQEGVSLFTAQYRSKVTGVRCGGNKVDNQAAPNFTRIWEEDPEARKGKSTIWWAARHWGINQVRDRQYADGSTRPVQTLDPYWSGKVKKELRAIGLVPVRRGRQWLWYRPQDLKQEDLERVVARKPFGRVK